MGEYGVRIRLGLSAEDFLSAWNNIVSAIRGLGGEFERVKGVQLDLFGNIVRETRSATDAVERFSAALGFIPRVIAGITVAMVFFEIGRAISSVVENIVEMEGKLTRMAALEAQTGEEFRKVREELIDTAYTLRAEYAVSVDEAAEALVSLMKAGLSASQAMNVAKDVIKFAKIEMVEIGSATRDLIMIMSQFGMTTGETSRAIGALLNMSRMGIGTAADFARGLGEAGSAAKLMGLSLEEAGALMVLLERRLGSADEAGTRLNRALRELYDTATALGVAYRNVDGSLRPTIDIIRDITQKVREYGDSLDVLNQKFVGINERTRQFYTTLATVPEAELNQVFTEMKQGLVDLDTLFIRTLSSIETRTDYTWKSLEKKIVQDVFGSITRAIFNAGMNFGLIEKNMETLAVKALNMAEALNKIGTPAPWEVGALAQVVEEYAQLEYAQKGTISSTLALIDTMKLSDQVKQILLQRLYQLIPATATFGNTAASVSDTVDEFGNALNGAADKGQNLEAVFERLRTSGDNLLKALKDVEGSLKDVGTAAEIGAEATAVLFFKWATDYQTFKQRVEETTRDFIQNKDIIQEKWKQFGGAFVETLENAVKEGKIKLDTATKIIESLASALGDIVPKEEIILRLTLAYDEAQAAKEAEKARQDIARLQEEADKAVTKISEIMLGWLRGRENLGMFTKDLERINDIINEMRSKGVDIKFVAKAEELMQFIQQLNNMTITINAQIQAFNLLGNVVSGVSQAYRTLIDYNNGLTTAERARRDMISILRSKNALVEEEIEAIKTYLQFLKEEHAITQDEAAIVEHLIALRIKYNQVTSSTERKAIDQEIATLLDTLKENTRDVTEESLRQSATMERLGRIQNFVSMQSQFLSLGLQAIQFAMLGSGETARQVTGFLQLFADTMKDGVITAEEERDILKQLGVTFGETGKASIDFSGMLTTLAETIKKVTENVNGLASALNSLPRDIVINIRVNQQGGTGGGGGGVKITGYFDDNQPPITGYFDGTVVGGGLAYNAPSPSTGIVHTTGGRFFEAYQHGAWYVPRTGPAIIHEGEMVIPKNIADIIRTTGFGVNVGAINIVVNTAAGEPSKIAEEISREMVKRLRRLGMR